MAQESSKHDKENTGYQPQEGPVLCSNGCGFFGSIATMNLCSKCYKDVVSEEVKATSAKVAAEKLSLAPALNIDLSDEYIPSPTIEVPYTSIEVDSLTDGAADSSSIGQASSTGSKEPVPPPPNRCFTCKKRVGLTGIKCRCGHTFCSMHRYSDKHDCTFDYKSAGRDDIAQANPVVKPAKVQNKI